MTLPHQGNDMIRKYKHTLTFEWNLWYLEIKWVW